MNIFAKMLGLPQYPAVVDGYTINYNDPYWKECPTCGSTTYQTVEEICYCYCPKCQRLLVHEE